MIFASTYIPTSSQLAAAKRMDEERTTIVNRLILRYKRESDARKREIIEKDLDMKKKAVIAFQTGRKVR